jgi:hypothetical protein
LRQLDYGPVSQIENCPIQNLAKSGYGYSGSANIEGLDYSFSNSTEEYVAAVVAVASGNVIKPVEVKDVDLAKLAKTIDLLVKAQKKGLANQYEHMQSAQNQQPIEPVQPTAVQPAQNQTKGADGKVRVPKIPSIKKPLQKMALIHNDPNKPMTVYRVQNNKGEGPYKANHPTNQFDVSRTLMMLPEKNTPYPDEDYSFQERHEMDQAPHRYGFDSVKGAEDWFGGEGLSNLARFGYSLVPVKASKVYRGKTGKQIVFVPHSSETALNMAKSDWPMSVEKDKIQKPLKITKSESQKPCGVCGQKMFSNDKFTGCVCFSPMAKSVKVAVGNDNLTLSFSEDWDDEAYLALIGVLKRGR